MQNYVIAALTSGATLLGCAGCASNRSAEVDVKVS